MAGLKHLLEILHVESKRELLINNDYIELLNSSSSFKLY